MKPRIILSLVIIGLFFFSAGCAADTPEPTAEPTPEPEIEQPEPAAEEPEESAPAKPIRIGINANAIPPLVVMEGETTTGFEIGLATEIAARLAGGEPDGEPQIEWVPITAQERFSSLADGHIDMLVRSILHTASREEMALFSGGYLLSGTGFLVAQESGMASIADLDEKTVAIISQYEESLNQTAGAFGITLTPMPVENQEELQGLIGFDQVDAIYHDWLFLTSMMDTSAHAIITDPLLLGPIGVAFSLENQELRDRVDMILKEMIADDTWQALFDEWIGIPAPWNVEEMFSFPPAN